MAKNHVIILPYFTPKHHPEHANKGAHAVHFLLLRATVGSPKSWRSHHSTVELGQVLQGHGPCSVLPCHRWFEGLGVLKPSLTARAQHPGENLEVNFAFASPLTCKPLCIDGELEGAAGWHFGWSKPWPLTGLLRDVFPRG